MGAPRRPRPTTATAGRDIWRHTLAVRAEADRDDDAVPFNVASNTECSSLLPMKIHLITAPQVFEERVLSLATRRVDTLLREASLPPRLFDFLNMDLQGAELVALRGMPW